MKIIDDSIKLLLPALIAIVLFLPKHIEADTYFPPILTNLDIITNKVIDCESSGNNNKVGDLNYPYHAYGILQYQIRTFNELKQKANLIELNIENAQDQITLFRWSVINGYGKLWSCYRKLGL